MTTQRYNLEDVGHGYCLRCKMAESPDGEWVQYEAWRAAVDTWKVLATAAVDKVRALEARLAELEGEQ